MLVDSDSQTEYGFRSLQEQPSVVRTLKGMLDADRLPQGLLFSGMPGTGRDRAARTLMMHENCASPSVPCGACRSCTRIRNGQHPDFIRVTATNGVVRVDSIRSLLERLIRKPHEARRRLVVLEQAESMNLEAANALLKVLEEPPEATCFILLSEDPHRLPATVRSRCQEIRFQPLSLHHLTDTVHGSAPDREAAEAAAKIACGNLDLAFALARESHKRRTLATILAAGLPLAPGTALTLSEWLAPDRVHAETGLSILESLFRDICLAALDPDVLCIHGFSLDCREAILAAGKKILHEESLAIIRRIREVRRGMAQNILPRLALDAILLDLQYPSPCGYTG
ncbi:DNA polymerase III subunit delta' [Desulfobotulus sp. H1]|uniref:DNA polymerase III subunit delta n=1 Tax=Desulfobotulus pelophilus TaxID=2823377 RepID=A0ABT3N886_9BACT|nr:DNA polymerase III subunit delta' [Desulfobotulus pelophilus]MCW7753669.1 DNA polymerase III subunit delta' [Desulfobotulus pelophilus]